MGHHIKVMLREAAVLSNCGTLKTTSLPVCSLLPHRLHTPLCCVQLSLANGPFYTYSLRSRGAFPYRKRTTYTADMSMRGPSGKFSLANFGRKASGTHDGVQNGYGSEMPESPTREGGSGFMSGGGGGGNGSSPLDGLGKKLGKSLAHQSLLPGLGNKEQRSLQE